MDPGALEKAISRVLCDPGLATRLGKAGRRRVELLYDWSVIVGKVLKNYDQIAR
jgi:glycosyltransferase involved in cell wall biosynthesis